MVVAGVKGQGMGIVGLEPDSEKENLWWFWTTWTDCVKPGGSDDGFLSLVSVMFEGNLHVDPATQCH